MDMTQEQLAAEAVFHASVRFESAVVNSDTLLRILCFCFDGLIS